MAFACGLVAVHLAIRYADQRPLDHFSFRQTQTAITAFWLARNGLAAAYETPVVGTPWSIPFEFPVYQAVTAAISRGLGSGLDATGRLVSFAFLFACIPQVLAITRRLRLSPLVFPIFCVLLLSSPTYLYWGRTFMIETTALFFCVAAVRRGADLCVDPDDRRSAGLLALWLSLAMLQKSTTALPVVLVLAVAWAVTRRRGPAGAAHRTAADLAVAAVCFGAPLLVGALWTVFTDQVKTLNPFGQQLTAEALRSWYLGPVAQRFEWPLYEQVFWRRIADHNLGGVLGPLLMITALATTRASRATWVLCTALLLGVLPPLCFANLHLSHDYYTCGNLLFVLFALAVALGDLLARRIGPWVLLLALSGVVVRGYTVFATDYLPTEQTVYTDATDTEMAIATVLRRHVPPDRIFVAYDFDWSSSLAYLSERKAFMFSPLFAQIDRARVDPTRFVDVDTLRAVVACPKDERRLRQLLDWSVHGRRWTIGLVDDCYVAAPEQAPVVERATRTAASCEATSIALLPVPQSGAMRVVRLRLRRSATGPDDASYATGSTATDLHEMLDVTRRSRRPGIDRGPEPDLEFTRLVDLGATDDDAALRVFRRSHAQVDECRVVAPRDG